MSARRLASFAELTQAVGQLRGHRAWRGQAGSGAGAVLTLQFGPPLPHDNRWGEFSLLVYCAWRLVEADRILRTWREDADVALAPTLRQLDEAEVASATCSPWGDLTISFTCGRSLHVWNDAPFSEGSTCWFLGCQPPGFYEVSSRNQFFFQPRPD